MTRRRRRRRKKKNGLVRSLVLLGGAVTVGWVYGTVTSSTSVSQNQAQVYVTPSPIAFSTDFTLGTVVSSDITTTPTLEVLLNPTQVYTPTTDVMTPTQEILLTSTQMTTPTPEASKKLELWVGNPVDKLVAESLDGEFLFRFGVVGDTQYATNSCGGAERSSLPSLLAQTNPNLVIHTGDLMDWGWSGGAYSRFNQCFTNKLNGIPFFPTSGNHDQAQDGILQYRSFLSSLLSNPGLGDNFKLFPPSNTHESGSPSDLQYGTNYAFRYKNTYFISFEQGNEYWRNTPVGWVKNHLQQARSMEGIENIIVYMHMPFYTATMGESKTTKVSNLYEDLFREYDVTMVFSGHLHSYERYAVPDDGHKTKPENGAEQTFIFPNTFIHTIVTGGGGGPLKDCSWGIRHHEQSINFLAKCGIYHFVTIDVHENALIGNAHQVSGNNTTIIDSFKITDYYEEVIP